jgi:putative MATE family efflux protein
MWALKDSTATNISRLLAVGDDRKAVRYLELTITLALTVGLVLAVFVQATAGSALSILGAPPSSMLHQPALEYVRVRAIALPAVLFTTAAEGAFRGFGDTRTPLLASSVAALVNLVADPLLMFPPVNLGMRGAAAATALAQVSAAGVYVWRLRRKTREIGIPLRLREQLQRLGSVIEEGKAVMASNGVLLVRTVSILAFWVLCSALATRLGAASAAAHFTMINLWLIFVLSSEAPGVAGQVLSARAIAKGQPKYAKLLVPELIKISAVLGVLSLLALLGLRPLIATSFTHDAEIASQIRQLSVPVALSMPAVIVSISCESMLVGAGLLRWVSLSTLLVAATSSGLALALFAGGKGSVVGLWWVIQAMYARGSGGREAIGMIADGRTGSVRKHSAQALRAAARAPMPALCRARTPTQWLLPISPRALCSLAAGSSCGWSSPSRGYRL